MVNKEQCNKGHIQTEESESNNKDSQLIMGSEPRDREICPDCHGSGSLADNTCSSCNGIGVI